MTTTPAKILKTPDTDLSEMDDDAIKKLSGGVVKRTIKLVLEASEEPADSWNEPVLDFLRVAAHVSTKHPIMAAAMVGLIEKDGPAGVVTCLIDLAKDSGDEPVREFLKLLRGELLSGDADRATAFKAKMAELETALG